MIILVEGPDGSGKTTLCNVFVKDYGFEYIHLGPQKDIEKTYKDLIEKLKNIKKDVVIDRAMLSNLVYSEIYGGQKLSTDKRAEFWMLLDEIILCLPKNKNEYLNEFSKLKEEREELYKDKMETVYNFFNEFTDVCVRYDRFKVKDVKKYVDNIVQSNRK